MPSGYPLNLILVGRPCLVIGANAEGALRARNLLHAEARVTVIGEQPSSAVVELAEQGQLRLEERRFLETDLDGVWLVVQALQDRSLAERVAALCQSRRLFFCAVDQPEHSNYSHLALARAGALTFAVGTEGRAPALGRKLREELTRLLNESKAAEQVERLAALREATPAAARREVLGKAVEGVHFTGKLRFEDD